MSICNTVILGENINLAEICPRLAQEGGFDCITPLQFKTLEEVLNDKHWSTHLIAPNKPFFQNTHNQQEFNNYIEEYLEEKARFIYGDNITTQAMNLFKLESFKKIILHVLITKCHF